MGNFYDSSFDCYMQCVTTRGIFSEQLKVGTVYHCKTKFLMVKIYILMYFFHMIMEI